jgi:hypothetical protein
VEPAGIETLTSMLHVEAKLAHAPTHDTGSAKASSHSAQQVDEAIVAVIALALELEGQPEASRIATQRTTSFWAMSGRARVLRGL